MHCPECSFKNPEKGKFCMECAASLISIDHSHLSKRSHQQLAGERKHATIMKSILKKIKTVQERISRLNELSLKTNSFEDIDLQWDLNELEKVSI